MLYLRKAKSFSSVEHPQIKHHYDFASGSLHWKTPPPANPERSVSLSKYGTSGAHYTDIANIFQPTHYLPKQVRQKDTELMVS